MFIFLWFMSIIITAFLYRQMIKRFGMPSYETTPIIIVLGIFMIIPFVNIILACILFIITEVEEGTFFKNWGTGLQKVVKKILFIKE